MKKLVLSLSVVFALGMVACTSSDKSSANDSDSTAVENTDGVDEMTDVNVVNEGENHLDAAQAETEEAGASVSEAADDVKDGVKETVKGKVEEAKDKASEAVDKAVDKAATKTSEAVQSAAEKAKEKAAAAAAKAKEKLGK